MTASTLLELFGYLGSAIVIVSMLMTSVMKLRVINTTGSLMFSLYALLIHSYPTMIMNLFLAGINIWQIMKLRNTHRHYDLIPVGEEDGFLAYLLDRFRDDILRYFPDFDPEEIRDCQGFIICCQSVPAGVFLGRIVSSKENTSADPPSKGNTLRVLLDYTTPAYRDCSVGKHLYSTLPAYGIRELFVPKASIPHVRYLRKMGFSEGGSGEFHLRMIP